MALRLSTEDRAVMESRLDQYRQATQRHMQDFQAATLQHNSRMESALRSRDQEITSLQAKADEAKHLSKQGDMAHAHEINVFKQSEATLKADKAKAVEAIRALQIDAERVKAQHLANLETEVERRTASLRVDAERVKAQHLADTEAEVTRRTAALRTEHLRERDTALSLLQKDMKHKSDITNLQLRNEHVEAINVLKAAHREELAESQRRKDQIEMQHETMWLEMDSRLSELNQARADLQRSRADTKGVTDQLREQQEETVKAKHELALRRSDVAPAPVTTPPDLITLTEHQRRLERSKQQLQATLLHHVGAIVEKNERLNTEKMKELKREHEDALILASRPTQLQAPNISEVELKELYDLRTDMYWLRPELTKVKGENAELRTEAAHLQQMVQELGEQNERATISVGRMARQVEPEPTEHQSEQERQNGQQRQTYQKPPKRSQ